MSPCPCDATGIAFYEALAEASKRGVNVKVIVSGDWESWSQTFNLDRSIKWEKSCDRILLNSGVKLYNTSIVKKWYLHDKFLTVDGHTAVVGGQNISNAWSQSDGMNDYFRDSDVLVSGAVVTQIDKRFISMLQQLHADPASYSTLVKTVKNNEERFFEKKLLGNRDKQYKTWLTEKKPGLCRFVSQEPHRKIFSLLETYAFLVQNLKSNLVMQVPQLSMGESFKDVRRNTLRDEIIKFHQEKGGKVELITNGVGYIDSKIIQDYYLLLQKMPANVLGVVKNFVAQSFAARTYDDLSLHDFSVYTYPRWHHGKIWLFDDTIVANIFSDSRLDPNSQKILFAHCI